MVKSASSEYNASTLTTRHSHSIPKRCTGAYRLSAARFRRQWTMSHIAGRIYKRHYRTIQSGNVTVADL